MKKRKLNSKNPKYKTIAEIKSSKKPILKQYLIGEAHGCKIYATFYK